MAKNDFINLVSDRHSAITDGVFAIAMTILVLEIAVPTITDISSGVALNDYFINYLAPSILIYFISFYLVYNFWENTIILFNFKKVSYGILLLNMFSMAAVCLIPFATGFLFKFYKYTIVNVFFSLLILIISLLYIIIFVLLLRNNFKDYFDKKEEIKTAIKDYSDGIELPNLKLRLKGVTLTLFYILLAPVISSLISLVLAFISPIASMLSFLLILILVFIIRMRRSRKDDHDDVDLTDDEKEFIDNIKKSIYGKVRD
ncbi:TMEM175 family protein [Methanobrevibacter sp.]|uniref:TMEM175 family protein n=1 Tax=Methanobrevibacter sp. TaxID=66852 RepID=UPI003869C1AA